MICGIADGRMGYDRLQSYPQPFCTVVGQSLPVWMATGAGGWVVFLTTTVQRSFPCKQFHAVPCHAMHGSKICIFIPPLPVSHNGVLCTFMIDLYAGEVELPKSIHKILDSDGIRVWTYRQRKSL